MSFIEIWRLWFEGYDLIVMIWTWWFERYNMMAMIRTKWFEVDDSKVGIESHDLNVIWLIWLWFKGCDLKVRIWRLRFEGWFVRNLLKILIRRLWLKSDDSSVMSWRLWFGNDDSKIMIWKLWFEDYDLSYLKVTVWRLWYEGYDGCDSKVDT